MTSLNPQAEELNSILIQNNRSAYDMLSLRGKEIYFPKKGILSQSAEAKGKKINATLGMALEDDGKPMVLNGIRNMIQCNNPEEGFSYAPSFGNPELRKVWVEKMRQQNPTLKDKNISLPVVSSALTHGISMAAYLFVDEGDSVVTPDYYWENYDLIFSNACHANLKTFPTFDGKGFNIAGMKERIIKESSQKVILILNFPNNPTGYTVTQSEALEIRNALVDLAKSGKKIVCLIDDAYFGLVYEEGIIRESLFSYLADAHENLLAIKLDGPTKEDYVWGFRVGFLTFGVKGGNSGLYGALENKIGGAIRSNISNASHLAQILLLQEYKHVRYEEEKAKKYQTLKNRYLKVKEIFSSHPEYSSCFEALPFNSGYFMCVEIKHREAEKVRQLLLQKYSIGLIAFNRLLRVAFSSVPITELENLFEGLYKACQE